jgi:hypothetical protein
MKNDETKKGYPASPQDSQQNNQFENVPSDAIIPYEGILPKNRVFGRIEGHLEHNQIVGWNVLLYSAYLDLLKDPNQYKFSISIRDFCDLAKLDYKNYYSHLFYKPGEKQKSLETLLKELKQANYRAEWKKNGEVYAVLDASLLAEFKIDKETGMIYFALPPFFHDNLLVSGDFYLLYLPVLGELKGSSYAPILYEQILQRRKFGEWRVRVDVLRLILGVENNEYKYSWKFHEKVLYPAIKIINEVAEIDLKVSKLKQGRNIIGYRFTWDPNAFEKIYKKYHVPKLEIKEETPDDPDENIVEVDELEEKPVNIVNTDNKPKVIPQSEQEEQQAASQELLNKSSQIDEILNLFPESARKHAKSAVSKWLSMYAFEDVRDAVKITFGKKKIENPFGCIESILENAPESLALERARIEEERMKKEREEQKIVRQKQEERKGKEEEKEFWEQKAKEEIARMSEEEKQAIAKELEKLAKLLNSSVEELLVSRIASILRQRNNQEEVKNE